MKSLLPKALLLCCLALFLSQFAKAQLSGSYTVDSTASGSKNYKSVTDAVDALYKSGVSGPVTFSISKGQYNGQLNFKGAITGASSTNTIAFEGKSGVSEDVVITTRIDTIIVNMSQVSYVSFSDLSIEAVDSTPTRIVMMSNGCEFNSFDNCNLTTLGGSRRPIVVSCNASDNNRWEKCSVTNGFMGFGFFGASSTSLGSNNVVKDCIIRSFSAYGVYLYHQEEAEVANNDIQTSANYWNMAGIYNYRSVGTDIDANTVLTSYSPMRVAESNVVVKGDTINITNNVFIADGNYASCVRHDESQMVNYFHNYMEGISGEALTIYTDNLNDIKFANNILQSDGNGWTCMSVYANDTTSSPLYWDHNDYFFSNYYFFMYSNRGYTSMADYQTAYGGQWNKNSLTEDPEWDYKINRSYSVKLNNKGVDMGIGKDIDGSTRPNTKDNKIDIGPNDYYLAPYDLDVYALNGPLSVSLTTNTISVVFKNTGTNDIKKTDVYVEYSVDSGKTWVKDTMVLKKLKVGATENFSFTKPWIPNRGGDFQLSVRISPPIKDDPDTKDQKDWQLCSGFQGSYTVGKGKDFEDLDEAVAILRCGVSGPLVFNIEPGSYNFNFDFEEIGGASNTNTITFKAAHRDSVSIYSASTLPTISLDGADFIHFESLTLENRNTSGIVAHMFNNADHNSFKDCNIFAVSVFPNWTCYAIAMAEDPTNTWNQSSSGSYNTFIGNTIKGGYNGVVMTGEGPGYTSNNSFLGNTIINSQASGILSNYQDSLEFIGNTVDSLSYTWSNAFQGQYISNFNVSGNRIFGGIYVYSGNGSGWNGIENSLVSNNELFSSDYPQTIYLSNSNNVSVQHNSSSYLGQGSGVGLYYCSEIDFRNNIISQKAGYVALQINSTTFSAFDFNNYTHNAQNLAEIDRTAYADLTALKAYNGSAHNQNSEGKDPDWVNNSRNLKPGSRFPDLYAPGVGIEMDIDSTSRCRYFTSLGAYEVPKTHLPVKADFIAPDTLWLGSPATIQNKLSPSIEYGSSWMVNGKFMSDSLHLVYQPTNTGPDTVTLIMDNCNGPDTLTKYVYVSQVLRAPKVNFSASSVELYTDELFKLFDLSGNGPTEWTWDITPKLAYDAFLGIVTNTFSIDSTAKSPSGVFYVSGDYTVKLRASNAMGSDSLTKTLFIRVRQAATMCSAQNETNGAFGTLFDDGGASGNYSKGLNGINRCTYRIFGCKGELEFDINDFDLANGDYLRMYDGDDHYGRPLWDATNFPKGMTGSKSDPSIPGSMTALSGTAYVVFESSDFSTTKEGFSIDWTAKKATWANPVASFNAPDTVCEGLPFVLENTSTGGWTYTQWDLDNDGKFDSTGNKVVHTVNTAQNLTVKLMAYSNCAQPDSFTKTIVVEAAKKKAKPDFSTSDTLTITGKTVVLEGSADYCVTDYRWEITPADYSLQANATLNDTYLPVVFTKSGKYTVKLVAENPAGADSVIKSNLIRVIEYCQPAVTNLNRDLGISKVSFNEIDNSTTVGEKGHANYTHLVANVEPGKAYPITVSRSSTGQAMNRKVWIDWNIDGDFDDADELVASESGASTLSFTDSVRTPPTARKGNTVMRISTNLASLNNTACGPHMFGEFEDYTIKVGDDITPPKMTLFGKLVDTIEVFGTWTEPGYKAYDLVNGNVTSKVVVTSALDNTVTGTYTIVYEIADDNGNKRSEYRTIVVADRTLPTISLGTGVKDTFFIQINEPVVDPTLVYDDNYDKALVVDRNGTIDNTTLGFYPVDYCVTDATGNGPACVRVVIQIGDSIAPKVTLNGANPEVVDVFSKYTDQGITVVENHEYTTVTSGTWTGSTDVLGTFDLLYTVTDKAGNKVDVTREIQVVDRVAPELASASTIYIPRWTAFDAATDVSFEDNYYASTELTVSVVSDDVDINSIGNYTVEYEVSDPSGNKRSITVPVIVVETQETVGIEEEAIASLKLYPNPSNGVLNMELQLPDNGNFTVVIRNTLGQEVQTLNENAGGSFSKTLNLDNLSPSVYYVVIQGDGFELIEKFTLTD